MRLPCLLLAAAIIAAAPRPASALGFACGGSTGPGDFELTYSTEAKVVIAGIALTGAASFAALLYNSHQAAWGRRAWMPSRVVGVISGAATVSGGLIAIGLGEEDGIDDILGMSLIGVGVLAIAVAVRASGARALRDAHRGRDRGRLRLVVLIVVSVALFIST